MNILEKIEQQRRASTGGFSLHYGFLYSLILGMESKNVFEFGSGLSSEVILNALEETDGKLTSVDVRPIEQNNRTFYMKYPKWNYVRGDSTKILDDMNHEPYDVILHDGSHIGSEVLIDLEKIYPYLKQDGILITHDTLHPYKGEQMMKAVDEFAKDKSLERCTLPYGYGLTFFRNVKESKHKVTLSWEKIRKWTRKLT